MSFLDTILYSLKADAGRDAVVEHGPKGVRRTSKLQLAELIATARGGLARLGVEPGDRIGLLGSNSSRWIALDLAILAEGCVVVPLYARQSAAELAANARDAGVKAVLVQTRELASALVAVWPDAPVVGYAELLDSKPRTSPAVPRQPYDLCTLVYTSGTSGEAKGACITFANVDDMLPRTSAALSTLMKQAAGEDRVYHYLPLAFMGSRIVGWTCLFRDNPIELGSEPDRIVAELGMVEPHYFLNVPILLERFRDGVERALTDKGGMGLTLYRRGLDGALRQRQGKASLTDRLAARLAARVVFPKIRARFGGNLRFLICGSAALRDDVSEWFAAIGVPVYQVYGLTETTGIVTMDRGGDARTGAVGFPLEKFEVRLGEDDELQVRGPNIFAGYWKRSSETMAAFAGDWFRTGDRATIDPDGRITIIGRAKNVLVPASGHNVAPEPIEQRVMAEVPGITHAVVVGHARPHLGVLLFGPATDTAGVPAAIERVNATLPHYQRLRGWHLSPDPLTDVDGKLTANGKLRRRVIEAAHAADIEGLYR